MSRHVRSYRFLKIMQLQTSGIYGKQRERKLKDWNMRPSASQAALTMDMQCKIIPACRAITAHRQIGSSEMHWLHIITASGIEISMSSESKQVSDETVRTRASNLGYEW